MVFLYKYLLTFYLETIFLLLSIISFTGQYLISGALWNNIEQVQNYIKGILIINVSQLRMFEHSVST